MENFPFTLEKLRYMTALVERGREEELFHMVRSDLRPALSIYRELERDVTDSMYRKENRTEFSYELNSYYRIYSTFGKEDADKAMIDVASEYIRNYFPTATAVIESSDGRSCILLLNFSLPWLSGQTSSPLPRASARVSEQSP